MEKEETKEVKIKIPNYIAREALDFATDICYDWQEQKHYTREDVNMYWFTTDQLKKLIKHCMQEGARIALKEQEK